MGNIECKHKNHIPSSDIFPWNPRRNVYQTIRPYVYKCMDCEQYFHLTTRKTMPDPETAGFMKYA